MTGIILLLITKFSFSSNCMNFVWMVFDHHIWQPRHYHVNFLHVSAILQRGSGLSQMFVMVCYDYMLDYNPGPLVHSFHFCS